ncbi:hypothetical protein AGABI2DRAFT_202095 [Agaricus bisporus var. bisporus H97]|uniref:hypothetical protein n=1 Tax=Agaricus bisporus var. bisporus (strain H97 / ATCC MYA-4626 / FGSC 10389) TaxID=936046 RepID=UPI00029F6DC6|nr:hypothetical protein AGABI2DRAFT_202095 [Agaricus bisporus var. bisporus H97]EKV47863.1 hypothetical protein AGABI2DRAFT_202095 [Agaricus bisporus var. bisporus H97]
MHLYELGKNDDSISELDAPYSSKFTSRLDTPNYGTLDDEMTLLKTPSPSFFRRLGLTKPLRKHPFSQRYEVPEWTSLAVHTFFCIISYPVLLAFVQIAKGRTLFWTRLIVGIGSGITGVLLGNSLLQLSRRHLEATVWATVIHQSQNHYHPGVQFKRIARHVDDPTGFINGFRLFWNRIFYTGTARKNRTHYDARPWSMHVLFFLVAFVLSVVLPFIFGRIVVIDTEIQVGDARLGRIDGSTYTEVAINGDISDADNEKASALVDSVFNNTLLTWTLSSYSSHQSLPQVVDFQWTDPSNSSHSDVVYFSQRTKSQLKNTGHGLGTFETKRETNVLESSVHTPTSMTSLNAGMVPGNIVRQPQWGIRIKCDKIPGNNILPVSQAGQTYVFIPKDTIASLSDYYGKPPPTSFPIFGTKPGDQEWPSNMKQSDTFAAVPFWPNGVTLSYFSFPLYDIGSNGTGFVSLELALIRLNTSFAAQGQFSILGEAVPDANGLATHIGYDAVACIEIFEPWIVDVYNSSVGNPTSQKIVEKGNIVRDLETKKESLIGEPIRDPNVRKNLTSERMQAVYMAAHQNSVNQLVKEDGSADMDYVPSTIAIECTDGNGPFGYTSLSAQLFERFKARADATNLLPYMVGSGSLAVRSYSDRVLAFAFIQHLPLIITLASFLALGVCAALFVPKLPRNMPRRGLDLYSWLAAFYADELVIAGKPEGNGGQPGLPIGRKMDIEEIEQHIGEVRFRCVS